MTNSRDSKVFRYTFLTFVFVAVASWAVLQSAWTGDYRWACMVLAAGAAQLMLVNRMQQHDKLCEPIIIGRHQPEEQKTAVVTPDKEYVPTVSSHNGHRIKYGKIKKTKAEWEKLANAILNNNNRVVRDVVSIAGVFESITRHWVGIYAEFERLGWAENNTLTADGIAFFTAWQQGQIPPYPNTLDGQNPVRP